MRKERRNSSTPAADQPSLPPGTRLRTIGSVITRGAGWIRPSIGSGACSSQRQRRSAQPGERRAEQRDPLGALGSQQPQLDRHPPAHAVADQVGALDLRARRAGPRSHRRSKERRRLRRAACRNRRTRAGPSRSPDSRRRARRPWGGTRPLSRPGRARRSRDRPRPPKASRSCRRGCGRMSKRSRRSSAMSLVAARKPTPRWRFWRTLSRPCAKCDHPTAHVTRDLLPGCPVGAQAQRRAGGSPAGCSSIAPPSIAASHSPSPINRQADASRAARHVDHLRIEPLDQGDQPGRWTAGASVQVDLDACRLPETPLWHRRLP